MRAFGFCLFIFLFSVFRVEAEDLALKSPAKNIKSVVDSVRSLVVSETGKLSDEILDAKLRDLIAPMFDFDKMSQQSLGANWNKATAEEQKEFVKLFSELLANTYLKRIKRNAEKSAITKISENIDNNSAYVKSTVNADGEDISINYRLSIIGGEWKIYDVVIENVGLVSNYRTEFGAIIRKSGFSGLISKLKDKQLTTANAAKTE